MVGLFVAYPFRPEAQLVVDSIIRPVLQDLGIRCYTGRGTHSSTVDAVNKLRDTIAQCSGLVAVVIGRNPNVFFEIGFATALTKPCFLLASNPSDAAMLEGTYPLIMTTSADCAIRDLRHLLQFWLPDLLCASAPVAAGPNRLRSMQP